MVDAGQKEIHGLKQATLNMRLLKYSKEETKYKYKYKYKIQIQIQTQNTNTKYIQAGDLKYAGVEVNQGGDRNDTSEEKTSPVHIIPGSLHFQMGFSEAYRNFFRLKFGIWTNWQVTQGNFSQIIGDLGQILSNPKYQAIQAKGLKVRDLKSGDLMPKDLWPGLLMNHQ